MAVQFKGKEHSHKCEKCACVWMHDPRRIPDTDEGRGTAHTCPKCGTEEYWVHHDRFTPQPDEPEYCSNGVRCIPLVSIEV